LSGKREYKYEEGMGKKADENIRWCLLRRKTPRITDVIDLIQVQKCTWGGGVKDKRLNKN